MKVVLIGGTGYIRRAVARQVTEHRHTAVATLTDPRVHRG